MKKSTTSSDIPVAKTEKPTPTRAAKKSTTKPVVAEAAKTTPEAPTTTDAPHKKARPAPKTVKKVPAVNLEPVASPLEISMHERVALTAGSVWHYLTENGATPVAKLVYEIPEEANVVQRSIGWLAQENKIMLTGGGDQIEMVELKG